MPSATGTTNAAGDSASTGIALWKVPSVRRFASASLISATGSAMAPLALAYSVVELGGGALDLALVLAANMVPTIVFLLAGGLIADRVSRSLLLCYGNLLAAGAQGVLALTVATEHATTESIAVCGLVSGIAVSFTAPAAQGAIAQIVPAEQLQRANAMLRLPTNTVRALAPAVSGVIVAVSGPAWALAWDALSFAVASLLLRGLRLDSPVITTSLITDLRMGWMGFWSRTWLWTYTAAGTVLVAAWLAGFQLLGPLTAALDYAGARDWGLIQSAYAVGLLTGTVVCLRWKPHRLLAVAVTTSGALALPLVAMGSGLPLPIVLSAALLAGIGLDIQYVTYSTAFQQHVPQTEQGRMSALSGLGERLAIPLGYLTTALATHSWDPLSVQLACAGLIITTTVVNLCVPAVYRVHRLMENDRPQNTRRKALSTPPEPTSTPSRSPAPPDPTAVPEP